MPLKTSCPRTLSPQPLDNARPLYILTSTAIRSSIFQKVDTSRLDYITLNHEFLIKDI